MVVLWLYRQLSLSVGNMQQRNIQNIQIFKIFKVVEHHTGKLLSNGSGKKRLHTVPIDFL